MKRFCILELLIAVGLVASIPQLFHTSFSPRDPTLFSGKESSFNVTYNNDWSFAELHADHGGTVQAFLRKDKDHAGASSILLGQESIYASSRRELCFRYHWEPSINANTLDYVGFEGIDVGYPLTFGKFFLSFYLASLFYAVRITRANTVIDVRRFGQILCSSPLAFFFLRPDGFKLSKVVLAPKLPEPSSFAALDNTIHRIRKGITNS